MNKYEKRFVILDLFCTGTILGWCVYVLRLSYINKMNIVWAIVMAAAYLLWMRPAIKNNLEEKELKEMMVYEST